MPESKRIVVTGGAGFYGSVLVRLLLSQGHRVHVVDNLLYGPQSLMELFINPDFSFHYGDILEPGLLARELEGADAVVHLAALVGYPLCKKFPDRATRVNVEGTERLLDLLPHDTALVYASTGSNYGEVVGVCTEDTPLNPLSLYGETKTRAEELCMARENSVSFRFATAFGLSPRMRLDLMINDFTFQALVQRYLLVYEKHFRRTFIHVLDMARAVDHALENWPSMKGEVYNCGHESMNYTKEDIVRILQEKLQFHVHFAEVGTDMDKRDYEVSYEKIRSRGYRTSVDIHRGVEELVAGISLLEVRKPFSNV